MIWTNWYIAAETAELEAQAIIAKNGAPKSVNMPHDLLANTESGKGTSFGWE